ILLVTSNGTIIIRYPPGEIIRMGKETRSSRIRITQYTLYVFCTVRLVVRIGTILYNLLRVIMKMCIGHVQRFKDSRIAKCAEGLPTDRFNDLGQHGVAAVAVQIPFTWSEVQFLLRR